MNDEAKKGSGEHPAVRAMRAKFASITDGELEDMKVLNERLDRIKSNTPPPLDARREDDEPVEAEVIELRQKDPFPETKK